MVDINSPTMVRFDDEYLDSPNSQALEVGHEKNKLASVRFPNTMDGEYLTWSDQMNRNYGNFMEMTTSPKRNPYGITGNKAAMKHLELQKPARKTTGKNPFMNVPITDYDRPQKFGRSENECGPKCKKNFYKTLFQSPDDALWNRSSSERQFYTTPNTSVPSEQTKFAEWLYGTNEVGKTGTIYDRYGYPYTSDSLVSTGVNAASPQNAGQVENNFGTPFVAGSSPWVNNPNYGYGFGGIPGAIPYPNMTPSNPMMMMAPYPLVPVFPNPVPYAQQIQQIPPQSNMQYR